MPKALPWCVLYACACLFGCSLESSGIFSEDLCTPATCDELFVECDAVDDGCGGFLDCGKCEEQAPCVDHACECLPLRCGEPSMECGQADDGCGGRLSCGDTCVHPETCGAGVPNICGCPDVCDALDEPECGQYWDPCKVKAVECGRSCRSDETCVDSTCAELSSDRVVINEFSWEFDYAELLGPPNLDLDDLHLIAIEGDRNTDQGRIRFAHPLGTLDDDGYLTIELDDEFVGTGTVTLLLVRDYIGATDGSTDIDTNNNGAFSFQPWSAIVDGVAIHNGVLGALTYTEAVLHRDFDGFDAHVGGASRIPNGTDTATANDWVRNDPTGFGIVDDTEPPPFGLALNTPAGRRGAGYNVSVE